MIIRSGIPKPLRGTAPAVPGAPLADVNALAPFQFLSECKTFSVLLVNTGAVPLRVFPQNPGLDPARWIEYYELAVGERFDGLLFEFTDMWLAGVGGPCTFKALLGLRVL
jgi:hypothetical protein